MRVISEALAVAGDSPETIGDVEAHGAGTPMGDQIEVKALTKTFRTKTRRRTFCGLGSVKTNIGHLDVASGVAGLIKTVLALEHRQIPATLNCEQERQELDLDESPFYISRHSRTWPVADTPRRACVSSLGLGGTNCPRCI